MEYQEENNIAEQEFKKWLDKHRIPYWYIQQDIDTFSQELKKQFTKRPDFFILIPNFGFILVIVSFNCAELLHLTTFIPSTSAISDRS